MSTKVYNGIDMGSTPISNLGAPSSANDAVRLADLNAAVEGLSSKDSVRVATQGNLNLASPGASIDSISMAVSDRVLVRANTAPAENGIYIWNGAAVPMTRALDANTANELEGATTIVEEGTSAGVTYRQTSVNFTLDSGGVTWVVFGSTVGAASETSSGIMELATQAETDTGTDDLRAVTPLKLATWSGRVKKASGTIGDGAATQYDATHNFGTKNVHVTVYRTASPWDTVLVDVSRPDTNTVRFNFAVAPSSAQFSYFITT
jgi:hypothetical protein